MGFKSEVKGKEIVFVLVFLTSNRKIPEGITVTAEKIILQLQGLIKNWLEDLLQACEH